MTAEKAGRWLRVSTSGQDEASQVPDVDKWCDARAYDVSQPPYVVHGGSAYKGNRKFDREWAKVLADFKAGRINVLVTWKSDRLDRKLQMLKMIEQVTELGGRIEFVTEPHLNDLSGMGGRIALYVQMEIAYAESKTKSDRIIATHAGLRQANSVIGRAPYGFRNLCDVCKRPAVRPACNGHLKVIVPVPAEASVIRDAAAWYLDGMTLEEICDKLNANDRLPRRMRNGHQPLWVPKTLSGVLRNPAVVGRRKNGEGFTVKPQAVLKREVWEAVIRRMDARATRQGVSQAAVPAMLTSVIKCGDHSRNMYKTGTGYYCRVKGCKNFITRTVADGWVDARMRSNDRRDMVEVAIPGGSHDAEIAEVKRDMNDAVAAEDFGRLAQLQGELERLRSLPAKAATVDRRESERTVAEMWQALAGDAERRGFLMDRGATVTFERRGDKARLVFDGPWLSLN